MAQFEPRKNAIAKLGAQVVFIAAEKRDGFFKPVGFLKKKPVSFPFLLDENREVTKVYGLYHRLGKDAINIAHPATLVIDGGGVLRFIYCGEGQLDRTPLEPVFEVLKKLKG